MPNDARLQALSQRALQLAETVRRAAAEIDARIAPALPADLVRTATVIARSLTTGSVHVHDDSFRRYLTSALTAVDELETLLSMAIGLELLGARGPKLVGELRRIRALLHVLRRERQGRRDGNAA